MAGNLILDDDYMVLQRKGDFDIKDEFYETNFPDKFPNIRIDTDIFHFTGEDLRYSCVEYITDSGKFVKTDGDIMTGNLQIRVPFDGEINQVEDNPELVLQGFRAGSDPYAVINLKNEARTSGFEQKIEAVGPNQSSTKEAYVQVGKTAFSNSGQIMMSGSKLDICALSSEASLNYITKSEWDTEPLSSTYRDMSTDIPAASKRLIWNSKGGSLTNSLAKTSLEWNEVGVYLWGNASKLIEVVDTHARYVGDIEHDDDITTKKYVDNQDWKYIPLKGTKVTEADGYQLEQNFVDGVIDFTNDGALNATINNHLRLTRGGEEKLTIDENVHVNADLDVEGNKIINVPLPSELLTDPDKDNAVPKEYIDKQVGALQELLDNIADIEAPPGMINAYVGETAPKGWFLCQKGVTYKCGKYKKLHLALGGKQSDIDDNPDEPFEVPDLSGRVLVQPGALSTASNTYPAGTYRLQPINQSTALPYKGRLTSNNKGKYILTGSHQHWIDSAQLKKIFDNSYFKVQALDAGEHSHVMGKTGNVDGSKSGGRFYPDPVTGTESTAEAGKHSHNVKPVDKQNISGDVLYTKSSSVPLYADDFDSYTMPYAYTINWIIKHDNVPDDDDDS